MNQEVLQTYSDEIRRLKNESLNSGISEDEFKELYFEALKRNIPNEKKYVSKTKKLFFIAFALVMCIGVYYLMAIFTCLLCNLQEYLYPGLKILRRLSIPFISLFPALTELYHESCLIQNPFFTVSNMDCWPCSQVINIRQIHDPKPVTQQYAAPFIYETEQTIVTSNHIQKFYLKNKANIDAENTNVLTRAKYLIQPSEMFVQIEKGEKETYVWKFITMNGARLLRQLIPRPIVVPKFGQSTERFILIDSSFNKIRIPDTECSFSFLLSLSGSRDIHIEPAEECKHQCRTLKVNLKESHLLWYNWWYWRPVIQPSNGNDTFVAHLGSYC